MSVQKIDKIDQIENKLIRDLIIQIFSQKGGLAKYNVHKILFKLKKELHDNPIGDYLPFYWYCFGPYSESVESVIKDLKDESILIEFPVSEDTNLLRINDRYKKGIRTQYIEEVFRTSPNNVEDIRKRLRSIVSHVRSNNFVPTLNNIYRDYSPRPFIPLFKLDFLDRLKDYTKSLKSPQKTIDQFIGLEVDRLESTLYNCEAELPSEQIFTSFNDIFSSFATDTSDIFEILRDENPKDILYYSELLLHTTKDIWFTFAKGIRIMKDCHDPYYDGYLEDWNDEFSESLDYLYMVVDDFDIKISDKIRNKPVKNLDNVSKNILSSIINGYLSED